MNYTYGRQNDVQYGNLTQIQEEGDIGGETNRQRLVYREYYPNPTTWVVNKVAREAVLPPAPGRRLRRLSASRKRKRAIIMMEIEQVGRFPPPKDCL